jgi:hypothetical protein
MQARKLDPIGFWSYSRQDDEHSGGRLSQLRARLSSELQINYGRDRVQIFQDSSAIPYGAEWDDVIRDALGRSTFFIPILTPNFIQSEFCLHEVEVFLEREQALHAAHPELAGHRRIFPILYIPITGKEARKPELVAELEQVQWLPFERLRHQDYDQPGVRQTVSEFAATICELLDRRIGDAAAASSVGTQAPRQTLREQPEPAPERAPAITGPAAATASEPDRPERISHGLAVAGAAGMLAVLVWLAMLPEKADDRLFMLLPVGLTLLAAFAGSFLARRLFDYDGPDPGLRRITLHALLAGGLAIPVWSILFFIGGVVIGALEGSQGMLGLIGLGATVGGVLAGFLIVFANLAAIFGVRRWPGQEYRLGGAALVLAAALALMFGVIFKSTAEEQEQLVVLMASKGELSGLNDTSNGPSHGSIVAAQSRLGLPSTGIPDDALIAALEAMPDRTQWDVGTGDDLGDILQRAAWTGRRGPNKQQTVLLAPGTYQLTPRSADQELYFGDMNLVMRGTGRRDETVIVVPKDGPTIMIDNDIIENLIFRQQAGSAKSLIATSGSGIRPSEGGSDQTVLRNLVVEASTTAEAVRINGDAHEDALIDNVTIRNSAGVALGIAGYPFDPSSTYDGKTTELPKATVRNSTLSGKQTAIVVSSEAAPLVEDNVIGPVGEGHGIYVVGEAGGTYRGNRISRTGNYAALAAGGSAKPEFDSNIVKDAAECVNFGEKTAVILRANRFSGCFGGTLADEARLRLSANDGLAAGDISVSSAARVTSE